ncbi:MAG: hypothetical protein JRH07_05505 [Deltaproteobacteria bacterium]|nr:hypothetical protein [Deltaproteobacteria bacterium]MBW2121288.1 hypothetical protein [Deltaproteobacteria bacterium]
MIEIRPVNPRWRFLAERIESEIAGDYRSRHDRNGDGLVERSEFSGTSAVFQRIDQNDNERLESSELKRYVDLLKRRWPMKDSEASGEKAQSDNELSFSASSYARLTGAVREFFSEEVCSLDKNGDGFVGTDEFVGTTEQFSALDRDENNLISSREWAEGFVETHNQIQMALKAYRFSQGIFQNTGGIVQMTV